ncbi:hypothetical protein F4808DRAFT_456013 [Astrocystis sublimbata]|nr:hypothetical protein F4808DRAFT_456013 [Astrocystis sublimbata]
MDIPTSLITPPTSVDNGALARKRPHILKDPLIDRLYGNAISHLCRKLNDSTCQCELNRALDEINNYRRYLDYNFPPIAPNSCVPMTTAGNEEGDLVVAASSRFGLEPRDIGIWTPMFLAARAYVPNGSLTTRYAKYFDPVYLLERLDDSTTTVTPHTLELPVQYPLAIDSQILHLVVGAVAHISCLREFLCRDWIPSRTLGEKLPAALRADSIDSLVSDVTNKIADNLNSHHISINLRQGIRDRGTKLHSIAAHFGGESFLAVFPFESLGPLSTLSDADEATRGFEDILGGILTSFEFNSFLGVLTGTLGKSLIDRSNNNDSLSQEGFWQHNNGIRAYYSLPEVSVNARHIKISNSCREMPLSFDLDTTPVLLLHSLCSYLGRGEIDYLIRKELPPEWSLRSESFFVEEMAELTGGAIPAGIIIPLLLYNIKWALVCYTIPAHSNANHTLRLLSPRDTVDDHTEAYQIILRNSPQNFHPSLRLQTITCQKTTRLEDSGIHVIANAISIARTGKPEQRLLDNHACDALRIKLFVQLLHRYQERVNQEVDLEAS